jgi:hypothetical protein
MMESFQVGQLFPLRTPDSGEKAVEADRIPRTVRIVTIAEVVVGHL